MNVHKEVIDIVKDYLKSDAVFLGNTKLDEIDIDSLDRLAILLEIEDKLNVSIPDAAMASWVHIGDISRSVKEALNGPEAA